MAKKHDWCWVYADELPELWEHFDIPILVRLKLELIDYEMEKNNG